MASPALLELAPRYLCNSHFLLLFPPAIFVIPTDPLLFLRLSKHILHWGPVLLILLPGKLYHELSYDLLFWLTLDLCSQITLEVKHFLTTLYKITMCSLLLALFDFFLPGACLHLIILLMAITYVVWTFLLSYLIQIFA